MVRKIIFADSFHLTEEAKQEISSLGTIVSLSLHQRGQLLLESENADIIVAEYAVINEELIERAKNLKGIVVYGVGVDHVNLNAASKRGIPVGNCRGGNAEAVAELALSLMLECIRWTGRANEYVRSGKWKFADSAYLPTWVMGREMKGKKLGIVGAGAIGTRIGELAEAFGMTVCVTLGRKKSHPRFPWLPLEELLPRSDIVSINVPLVPETRGLFSRELFPLMKEGSILIVTSRGGIVDEVALAEALLSGRIAGAGLDVFASEPIPQDSPLFSVPNIVLTPHMGGSTEEAVSNISNIVVECCKRLLEGKLPITTVNLELLQQYGYYSEYAEKSVL